MVNKSREDRDGGFETSDVLITVLTSAALPVASRILALAFGDNSLWSVDRLFIIYFASFSGRDIEKLSPACRGEKRNEG